MEDKEVNEVLSETENLIAWRNKEDDVGYIYHLELGNISLHLMPEDWDELLTLMRALEG